MTDFATWCRRADGRLNRRLGLGVVAGLMLTGCGASPTVEAPPAPAPPPPAAPTDSSGAVPAGLTPLPSSQQVVSAFRMGRQDPFGSLVPELVPGATVAGAKMPAAVAATPPAFLKQLQITGVIQSGGQSEVIATSGVETGSLRRGDRGGLETKLIPPGWRVASVDLASRRLILQSGDRKVSKPLPPP